jgi:hypothetical protein
MAVKRNFANFIENLAEYMFRSRIFQFDKPPEAVFFFVYLLLSSLFSSLPPKLERNVG